MTLSHSVYTQVLNLYATIDPDFKQFLAMYRAAIRRSGQIPGPIYQWKPPDNLASKYTKYLTNTDVAYTIKRATFKGVEFNTEAHQTVQPFPVLSICSLDVCFLFPLYVSYMSLICLLYVSYMSPICLSTMSVSGLSLIYLIQTHTPTHSFMSCIFAGQAGLQLFCSEYLS